MFTSSKVAVQSFAAFKVTQIPVSSLTTEARLRGTVLTSSTTISFGRGTPGATLNLTLSGMSIFSGTCVFVKVLPELVVVYLSIGSSLTV